MACRIARVCSLAGSTPFDPAATWNYRSGHVGTFEPPSCNGLTGTPALAKIVIVKNNSYVYSSEPKSANGSFTWLDDNPTAGKVSYYYVRGEQDDGEIVWVSPMWVTYKGK